MIVNQLTKTKKRTRNPNKIDKSVDNTKVTGIILHKDASVNRLIKRLTTNDVEHSL